MHSNSVITLSSESAATSRIAKLAAIGIAAGAIAALLGCDKSASTQPAAQESAASSANGAAAVATASAATATATASEPVPSSTASALSAAIATASAAASTRAAPKASVTAGASAGTTAATASNATLTNTAPITPELLASALGTVARKSPPQMVASGTKSNHYIVNYSALSGCTINAPCTGAVTLTAEGGYHINNEFPYKFVVDPAEGLSWQTSDGRSFGKATGEFVKASETTALISLRFRGQQAGPIKLSGTFKMSVCSEANCQVESVPVSVNVTFQ